MKRIIEIGTRGTQLFLERRRLVVRRDEEDLARIPLEDIGVVVVDSTGVTISSGALKALAEHGATLLACDDTHHPNGLFLPLVSNSLHGERIRHQAEASAPLKKNLWAAIVRRKILNQSHMVQEPLKGGLIRLAERVKSGDSGHCESQAARSYWKGFFEGINGIETPFRRNRDGAPPNNLLNYGYAVMRAAVARALCGAGLHPGLGIHHRNRYNGYCLADDLLEPFRPFVDRMVRRYAGKGRVEMDKDLKMDLIKVLTEQVCVGKETISIELAVERSAASLAQSFVASGKNGISAPKAVTRLILPAPLTKKPS